MEGRMGSGRGLGAVVAAYRRRCFTGLFATLLLTLGAAPTLVAVVPRHNPLQVLLALNLAAAIASVAQQGHMRVPLLLGGGFIAARILLALLGVPALLAVSEGFWVTAVVLATAGAARHAFRGGGVVDRERIMAALDAYLLVGLVFGVAYTMLDRVWPASFGGAVVQPLTLPEAMYFSFVTIATLGYGDIVPLSAPARGLAVVEAVSGQLYLTVLVARLVGLYARDRRP
jgi:hypothetical protein